MIKNFRKRNISRNLFNEQMYQGDIDWNISRYRNDDTFVLQTKSHSQNHKKIALIIS